MKSDVVCRQLVEILNAPIPKSELLVPLVASIWNMSTRPDNRQVRLLRFIISYSWLTFEIFHKFDIVPCLSKLLLQYASFCL